MQESHFTDAFLNGAGMAGNNGAKGPVEHTKIAVIQSFQWSVSLFRTSVTRPFLMEPYAIYIYIQDTSSEANSAY